MSARPNGIDELNRWIDDHHAEQIEFLRAIVRVPSDTPPGDNAPAAEKAADLLSAMGFAVERHPVPVEFLRAYGMRSVTNLIVRQRFGSGGATIALNAHGDVVPPGEGWTKPPYDGAIENGRMYGRGVAVSKSDIATFTYALAALRAQAAELARLNGTVELHFTYDEEFGGLAGPAFLLDNKLTKPDYAIAASFSYAVVTAHNGCLQLEVTVHGKSGHGAMPESGRDAFRAGVTILRAIYDKAVVGEDIPAVGVPLYADARLYGEHGVPIVMYGAGPRTLGESNAKRPDENLLLEDLRRATKVVAATVHDLLSA